MATIVEDYISFEVAKLLKEKGFNISNISLGIKNWICCMYDESGNIHWGIYDKNWYFRITHQMARKWLRKMHNIFISINLTLTEEPDEYPPMYYVYIHNTKTGKSLITYNEANLVVDENRQPRCFAEPEEAVEIALKYVLENLI